jgi:hypothetical protein
MTEEKIDDKLNEKVELPVVPANNAAIVESAKLTRPAEQSRESAGEAAVRQAVEQPAAAAVTGELPADPAKNIVAASYLATEQKERQKKVEKILEIDLAAIYNSLTPEKKVEFKVAGEKAAREIAGLLAEATVQVKKIIEIIINWLKVVPGINKFFVEQEAKIKADEIMKLRDQK